MDGATHSTIRLAALEDGVMKAIVVLILAASCIFAAPLPVPDGKPRGPQVVPGRYTASWADSKEELMQLYKEGTFRYTYTYWYDPYSGCCANPDPENPPHWTTEYCIGRWKWDAKKRILYLHEDWSSFEQVDRKFEFKFEARTLVAPVTKNDGHSLILRPLERSK
jgi:hypothetical protein